MYEDQLSQIARYVAIAVDIATRIVRGEYREGQKIFGRSTLAGKYNVSPETIRRALILLQETGIVDVIPGVGVVVKSHRAAEVYLAEYGQKQVLRDIQERLTMLLRERDRVDAEIERLTKDLLDYTFKMVGRLQKIDEVRVWPGSPLVGKTLVELDFRARTGATVLSIYRNGREILSPEAKTVIQSGDVLIVVGPPEVKEAVSNLAREVSSPERSPGDNYVMLDTDNDKTSGAEKPGPELG
jgi:K+/H+ antiporter YhaU regulatory subunit KhtT